MNLSKRISLAALLVISAFGIQNSHPQISNSQGRPATITGKVTIKGKTMPGVVVVTRTDASARPEIIARVTTDQDGRYLITNLPAGSYRIFPTVQAFVVVDDSPRMGKNVIVNEGETIEGVDFALVRGGVITGRVTDTDGRPVIQQRVEIFRGDAWDEGAAPRGIFPVTGATTDDRGIYRVFGLTAGRYKVAVGRGDDTLAQPPMPGRAVYSRVFHPHVTEQAKATIIEVTEGSEFTDIDIALGRAVDTYSINGRAVADEKELGVPGLRLFLELVAGGSQTYSSFTTTNALGVFEIDAVSPGKYVISLIAERGNELMMDSVPLEVTDSDVTGVVLKLRRGASIGGFVGVESDNPAVLAKLRDADLRVNVIPTSGGPGGQGSVSSIGGDGSFRVSGLAAGTVRFQLSGRNPPGPVKNLLITRIERDGVIQPQTSIELKDGEQIAGLRVVVSYGDASLRGIVKAESGTSPMNQLYFVRVTRSGDPLSAVAFAQSDARGQFLIEGLPGGIYDIYVMPRTVDGRVGRNIKQQVSLTSGATTEITVTINPNDQ